MVGLYSVLNDNSMNLVQIQAEKSIFKLFKIMDLSLSMEAKSKYVQIQGEKSILIGLKIMNFFRSTISGKEGL